MVVAVAVVLARREEMGLVPFLAMVGQAFLLP
jgi:hypothetical protein